MFHNLHEFALASQAGEYLIGLTGLGLFLLFWRWVNKPRKPRVTGSR